MSIRNKHKTILIIEDDIESNNNLSFLLQSKFAKVFVAYDGLEGWKLYQEKAPDVILTDIEMPKMDGLELIRRIRVNNSTVPIIVLSSYSHQNYLLEAIPMKLESYLLKPITKNKLDILLQKLENSTKNDQKKTINLDDNTTYNFQNKSISWNGNEIKLSHLEILLIELLLKNRGNIVPYDEIEYALYSAHEVSRNALKIIVSNLRKKIPANLIQATPKLGYRLL